MTDYMPMLQFNSGIYHPLTLCPSYHITLSSSSGRADQQDAGTSVVVISVKRCIKTSIANHTVLQNRNKLAYLPQCQHPQAYPNLGSIGGGACYNPEQTYENMLLVL